MPWGGDRYPCAPGCHTGIAVLTPLGWQGLQARHPARFFHFLVARTALDGRGTEFLGWRVGYLPPAAPDRPAARPVIRFIPPPHRPGTV